MNNEEQKNNQVVDSSVDYINAINQLKQSTVNKAEYDKLREDNKRLLDSIVNGGTATDNTPKTPQHRDVNEIRKELFKEDSNLSNLEFVSKSLELRNALIAKGETDPFLPQGKQILATDNDIETANRVAEVLQECVDYAQGDSNVFTNELQRRTMDVRVR